MTPTLRHGRNRDNVVLLLVGLVILITFLADAIGWFRVGLWIR